MNEEQAEEQFQARYDQAMDETARREEAGGAEAAVMDEEHERDGAARLEQLVRPVCYERGKWHFYIEGERYGPYDAKEEAKTALMKHCYGGKAK